MKIHGLVGFFALVVLVTAVSVSSQVASDTHTIAGTVKNVFQSYGGGTHVLLDHQGKSIEVCLGQSGFLEANDSMPMVGDRIEVEGLMTQSGQGKLLLVAQSIREGDRELELYRCGGSPGCCCHGGLHQHGGHCHHGHHHEWHE